MIMVKELSAATRQRIENGEDEDFLIKMKLGNPTMHRCPDWDFMLIDRSVDEFNSCLCDLGNPEFVIKPKPKDDGGDGLFLEGNKLTLRIGSGTFEQIMFISDEFIYGSGEL